MRVLVKITFETEIDPNNYDKPMKESPTDMVNDDLELDPASFFESAYASRDFEVTAVEI